MADLAPIEIEGSPTPPPAPPPAEKIYKTEDPGHGALVDDQGQVQSVPIENIGKAKELGWRPASESEWRQARDGTLGQVAATVAGAARGATFGLSDAAEVGLGGLIGGDAGAEKVRQGLSEDIEDHPYASAAGEIGGSLLPLAFGAPPAEAAAAGESMLARAGTRAIQAAPRLFAEGVPFGMGHQLTEDILGKRELVAGKYVTAGLEGGLVNLLLGSALHAGGAAIGDALAARGTSTLAKAGEAEGESLGQRLIGKLRATAEEQAAKGAMPASSLAAAEMQKLGRTAEEQQTRLRQVGRTLLDEGVTTPGASKAVQATRLTERVESTGKGLDEIRKKLSATGLRPDADGILTKIQSEVLDPLAAKPFSTPEMRSLDPYMADIEHALRKDGGPTLDDLHVLRRELDKKLDPKLWQKIPGTAPAAFEELGRIRGILEGEYEATADRAANMIGEDVANTYRVKKALYGDLKTAERWAKKGAAREAQNRAVSLTDTIMAGAGIASGHGAVAVGGALANKAMRTYGNQAAAYALDRISKLEVLQRAAAAFDTKLAASTEAFFGKGSPPKTAKARPAITPEERVALRNAMRTPGVLAEHVADNVARTGLGDAAPNVAGATINMVLRAGTWVASKLPPEPAAIGVSAFGPTKPRELGPRAQADIDRAINALDTDKMLDDLAHRQLSREQVEALKFVNPDLYFAMRKSVRDYGAANNPDMSIQQEMALSIVFDTPVSSYTRGATIKGFQKAFTQGAPSDPASAGGSPGKPIGSGHSSAAESLASPTDRAEANGAL